MARLDLSNLETYQTPKERLREAFWTLVRVAFVGVVAWDLSVYAIKFWESGRAMRLILPVGMAILLGYVFKMVDIKRRRWLLVPAVLALIAPVALHLLEQRVQPGTRYLSDAYNSAISGAFSSAPASAR